MTEQIVTSPEAPAEIARRGISPDTVTRQVLENGLTVVVYSNPATPAVSARLSTKAGAIFDPPDLPGLAAFTARAMRRGTLKQTFDQINQRTEERGLSVGIDAGYHLIEVGGRSLSEDAGFLLATIAEIALLSAFPLDELERLRSLVLTGLREEEDDTGTMASHAFRRNAYPADHPYSRSAGGTHESVSAIKREDMVRYFRTYLRPDRSTLVVVGDIQPADALNLAEDTLGGWANRGEAPPFAVPDAAPPAETIRVHHFIPGKTQNDLVLGFPAIRRDNPDYHAMELMNLLLGRIGLMGRLGKSVREEQGLAYHASSGFDAGFGPGPWAARAGVNPSNVNRAVESILREIRRIQDEPVSPEELQAGHRYLTGILPLRLETNEGLARTLLAIELHGLGLDYIKRYPQIVLSQGIEQIQQAAQRYLHPDRYVLATAGPEIED